MRFLERVCEGESESSDRPRANTSVALFIIWKSQTNELSGDDEVNQSHPNTPLTRAVV